MIFIDSVGLNYSHNFADHLVFQCFCFLSSGAIIQKIDAERVEFREVGIKPYFDSSFFIHTYEIFRNTKISYDFVQLLETLQRTEEKIEVFRIWNILNITETNGNMFNIYFGSELFFTTLVGFVWSEKFSVDDTVLSLAPLEELQELFELCGTADAKQVLFDFLVGVVISIEAVCAMIWFDFESGVGYF